eukprot:CAMPEP_0118971164 /NCGR_PEP_ID=MMETSP1173-20130426/7877_1 /TAXON_ID=1034831 /ORGANISM="Rhizochromulina marina cf, Strain CCMP1243" /LENGTH=50 /DNA_ID=CAMNT_0006920601 /DNA_START=765 /DNA_END=917 /DNA_ORIENTATION=-
MCTFDAIPLTSNNSFRGAGNDEAPLQGLARRLSGICKSSMSYPRGLIGLE